MKYCIISYYYAMFLFVGFIVSQKIIGGTYFFHPLTSHARHSSISASQKHGASGAIVFGEISWFKKAS